jgi:hypothetical protein
MNDMNFKLAETLQQVKILERRLAAEKSAHASDLDSLAWKFGNWRANHEVFEGHLLVLYH